MAKKNGNGGLPRWFRHRWLVEAEAVLLVGVAQELLQRQIGVLGLPNWGKTLWTMGCVLGIMGGLIMTLRVFAKQSVSKAHQTVQAMPVPAPYLFFHLAAFVCLFFLYAWVWDFWPVLGQRTLLR